MRKLIVIGVIGFVIGWMVAEYQLDQQADEQCIVEAGDEPDCIMRK